MHLESPLTITAAPTLEGTLSHTPQVLLAKLAKACSLPVSALATLTVHSCSNPLYNSILEYAALCPSQVSDVPNALAVVDYEPDKGDSSDDDGSDDSSRPSAGVGLKQRRYPIPKFKYSLGQTTLLWPPPPTATVEHIIAQRETKRQKNQNRKPSNSPSDVKQAPISDVLSDKLESVAINDGNEKEENEKETENEKEKDRPSRTIHLFHYSMGQPGITDNNQMITYREILLVTVEPNEVLREFAKEVIQWASDKDFVESDGSKFKLMRFKTNNCGEGWWQTEGMKRARPPSSVILPNGQIDVILEDIRKFVKIETKKWYLSHGLPHRRSYLFYGPPGTGKTSTIRAIASVFRLSCCFLSMTTANFSNQVLGDALSQIPPNALIVLEDVDALFNEDRKNEQSNNLTFSGLLNALDGLISADGVITVMTTNHIEKLDKALIRGGRVDRRFLFSKPTHEQIKSVFKSFYPDAAEDKAAKFLRTVLDRPNGEEVRSIATLQQLFIDQRENTADECIAAVPTFFESHFPSSAHSARASLYN